MACLVCSWIRPAIAIEPPEGISSVVSARRVLIEGIVRCRRHAQRHRVVGRDFGYFGHHPQADPAFGQHHRREIERDAELLEAESERSARSHRSRVWQVTPVGIGNSPPAMKVADSPEIAVRLGSASVRTTPALSMARSVAVTDGSRCCRTRPTTALLGPAAAVGGERVGVAEVHDRRAVVHAGGEVDAQLLDDRARDFGDRDLQHHLVAAADRDRIDDLVRAAGEARGQIVGLLRFDRACRRAGQAPRRRRRPRCGCPNSAAIASARRARR